MDTKILLGIFLVLAVTASGCTGTAPTQDQIAEQACTSSGGTVATQSCCLSAGNFPNTCLIGACGCSLENSHAVKTCDCGEGKCFNGTACVAG